MSDKKEAPAEAIEATEKVDNEKPKKSEKKTKKAKETKAGTESKTKSTKKVKKVKTVTKVVKKKSSKGTSETKPKTTKKKTTTKTTTKSTTTKPKKVTTTKPAKKVVKKPATKAKKETTEKSAAKPKDSTKKLRKYEKWIFDALVALGTEDKEFVSYEKIKKYLINYMDGSIESIIPSQTRKTLDELHDKGLLKKKKESFALTVKGKKLAPTSVPTRKKVQGRSDAPKRTLKMAIEEPPETKTVVTLSGRNSKQRVIQT